MIKSNLPFEIKKLKKMYENNEVDFNYPIQRGMGQWEKGRKSELIHSILSNYPVPNLYFLKENDGTRNIYKVLDGKQRLTSIFEFINGEFKLHKNTPPVKTEEGLVEIANLTFDELPKDFQEDIKRFKFTIYLFEDCTDEEIETIFFRLNNGVSLSIPQKTKSKLGLQLAIFTTVMTDKPFMTEKCKWSAIQLKSAENQAILLQAMMLLDDKLTSFSNKDVIAYASSLKGNYSEEQKDKLESILDYLDLAITEQQRFLKKINIPIIINLAAKALENKVSPEKFNKWFMDFIYDTETIEEYSNYCSSGSTKKPNVEGRIRVMTTHFDKYFNL